MADYYSLLLKAVGNLPKASPPTARKAIYDRARAALVRQLRSLGPTLSEADIAREEAALEAAVARLERDLSPPVAPSPRSPDVAAPTPPSAGPRPATPAPTQPPAAIANPPAAASRAPTTAPEPGAAAPQPTLRPPAPRAPNVGIAETPRRAIPPETTGRPVLGGRTLPPPPPPLPIAQRGHAGEPSAAPPISAASSRDFDAESRAPSLDAVADDPRPSYESDQLRPSAPSRLEAPRSNPLPWIVLAVVVGLVFSIAVAAFLLRQKPQDLAIKDQPTPTVDAGASTNTPKIIERVGGDQNAAPTPTPASTPTPSPDIATPAASPTPTASPTPAPSPLASATPAPQAAATPALPVSARAAMLVAVGADPQQPPAVSLGSVVWTTIPPVAGQSGAIGVKAEADIPDLKMHAVMTIRRNADASLPASHTIDLRVTFADGAEIKGIKDMRVPLMRRDDPPSQDSLAGVRVKISDSYFLVGLNRADADVAHNVDLLASRGWFDFPMLLNDDRIAKLTFEKGADGERILNEALAAWKGP